MANLEQKQVGFKTTAEVADLFDELYKEAQTKNQYLTKGVFFEQFVKENSQPKQPQSQPDNTAYDELNEFHKALDLDFRTFQQDLSLLLFDNPDQSTDEIIQEVVKLKKPIEVIQNQSTANQLNIELPEIHRKLLVETVKKLTDKYGKTVTEKDILLDMFVRYTIEQFSEWFYPFVIKDNDFEKITGHSQKELKQWLKI